MKQETIKKAVKVINRSIKYYQRKLTYQLELRAESELLNNKNLKFKSFEDFEGNIKKYEIILTDLATIKRAIKNNKESVEICGTDFSRGYIYDETQEVLNKAGFDIDGDGYGLIYLFEKDWVEGTPESWSIYEEGW